MQLPTLTEVVDLSELGAHRTVPGAVTVVPEVNIPLLVVPAGAPVGAPTVALRPEPAVVPASSPSPAFVPPLPLPSEQELVRRVMTELERQIDLMLEYRLREMLGPLLTRVADTLVRDTRTELASTLRDVVARAVTSELARLRVRPPER